jgi:hypothetical protein
MRHSTHPLGGRPGATRRRPSVSSWHPRPSAPAAPARSSACRVSRLESFCNLRGIVEVGLNRRRRAPQPVGDLRDRQILRFPIVASNRDSAPTLNDPIGHRARDVRRHGRDGTAADWCSRLGTPLAPSLARRHRRAHPGAVTSSKLARRAFRDIGRRGADARRPAKAGQPPGRVTRSLPHPATSRTAGPRVKLEGQFCLFVKAPYLCRVRLSSVGLGLNG